MHNKEREEYLSSITQYIADSEKRIEDLRQHIAKLVAVNGDTQLQDKMLSIMLKTVATTKRHRDQLAALPSLSKPTSGE